MTCPFTTEEKEMLKEASSKGLQVAVEKIDEHLDLWRDKELNIGIIGRPGVGKSSYINASRGLKAKDKGAAKVNEKHTTMLPTPYPDPKNPKLIFVDLPGLGAKGFEKENYLKLIDFEKYDCFLILTAVRFEENDRWIVDEIRKRGKQFLFVRTKVSNDYDSKKLREEPDCEDRRKEMCNELIKTILEDINIKENLGESFDEKDVFVIDNDHFGGEYEAVNQFGKLQERMIEIVPEQKQDALIRSFAVTSQNIVNQRAKELGKQIKWVAMKCAMKGAIAIPCCVPKASDSAETFIIREKVETFYKELGLDDDGLQLLANRYGADVRKLKELVESSESGLATAEGILNLIKQVSLAANLKVEEQGVKGWLMAIPVIASVVGAVASIAYASIVLRKILKKLKRTADEVMQAAVKEAMNQYIERHL